MTGGAENSRGLHGSTPVVLVGGLHAEARAAAVRQLLRTVPGSVALHHDLTTARSGTVRRTVRDRSGLLESGEARLVNDCACCALREDLIPELERLADGGLYTLAVVELWDSVEPQAMAEVVAAHAPEPLKLTGVLTAVDPGLVEPYLSCGDDLSDVGLAAAPTDQRTVADTLARQLEYPGDLVLAPSEDAAGSGPAALELLRQLHPTARHIPLGSAGLATAARAGYDVEAAAIRQHPACALLPQEADCHGVGTMVWHRTRPFHPDRLYAALEDLTCAAVRSRGRFWLADRPDTLLSWDAAGGALCVESAGPWLAALPDAAWELVPPARRAAVALDWHAQHGDRAQHLVFVAPALDRDGLTALLESCLLTDAELAAGEGEWRSLPSCFDELLDPVT